MADEAPRHVVLTSANAADTLRPYVESIFQLLHSIWEDGGRVDALMRASMGVLG